LKLYERYPDGRPRYLQVSSDQWSRGRRNEYFNGDVSRSEVCRKLAAERLRSLQQG
jgi:hypothetical protein